MRLQHRAEQQRAQAADAIADQAGGKPAHDAEAEHQRQHLGAARGAIAEIAAVGDDVDLRHRHRHAAGHAGDAQQHLQHAGREAERTTRLCASRRQPRRGRTPETPTPRGAGHTAASALRLRRPRRPWYLFARSERRWPLPQAQRERQHGREAEDADSEVGLAPADRFDEVLHDRRPDRAAEVVAARADRNRDAAPAIEPERRVGDQRREGGGAAEHADQQAVDQRELQQVGRHAGQRQSRRTGRRRR